LPEEAEADAVLIADLLGVSAWRSCTAGWTLLDHGAE
jgi:hypothetical protein